MVDNWIKETLKKQFVAKWQLFCVLQCIGLVLFYTLFGPNKLKRNVDTAYSINEAWCVYLFFKYKCSYLLVKLILCLTWTLFLFVSDLTPAFNLYIYICCLQVNERKRDLFSYSIHIKEANIKISNQMHTPLVLYLVN